MHLNGETFYISPLAYNTLNPSWDFFDSSDLEKEAKIANVFLLKIWTRYKCELHEISQPKLALDDKLFKEFSINLNELVSLYTADFEKLCCLPPNSLIFEFDNGLFGSKQLQNELVTTGVIEKVYHN